MRSVHKFTRMLKPQKFGESGSKQSRKQKGKCGEFYGRLDYRSSKSTQIAK